MLKCGRLSVCLKLGGKDRLFKDRKIGYAKEWSQCEAFHGEKYAFNVLRTVFKKIGDILQSKLNKKIDLDEITIKALNVCLVIEFKTLGIESGIAIYVCAVLQIFYILGNRWWSEQEGKREKFFTFLPNLWVHIKLNIFSIVSFQLWVQIFLCIEFWLFMH